MRKTLLMLIISIFIFAGCSVQKPQETTQSDSAAPTTAATADQEQSESTAQPTDADDSADDNTDDKVSIDKGLLDSEWEAIDLSGTPDLQSYKFYYTNKEQPTAYILMTLSPHYDDATDDLLAELMKNVESYTETTIPLSTYESSIGDIEYFQLDGYPACSFDITARLGSADEEFSARTVFVSTEGGIYCLQMQSPNKDSENYFNLFSQIEESLTVQ